MPGKIYVAGHTGMVGSALVRKLATLGSDRIVLRLHSELELCDQAAVEQFFQEERPEYVYLAAGKVGGIAANDAYPADFIRDNLQIQTNVIDAARRNGCRKLLILGSSCMYPKQCPQPMREDFILSGPLEPTNIGFAIAKIAGLIMGQTYRRQYDMDIISVIPANLYGPGDNFHPAEGHVVAGMIHRFHTAKKSDLKQMVVWGTGTPLREFLHVDDLADALIFLMWQYAGDRPVNVGSGVEISMFGLAKQIAGIVGFQGEVVTDPTRSDGNPRRLLDSSYISGMGWKPSIDFGDGLKETYKWFLEQQVIRHL